MEEGWTKAWPMYELGRISEDDFWDIFLRTAQAKKLDVAKAKELWRQYFGVKQGMLELVGQLKHSYTLGVASSTGKEWLEYKRERYQLDNFFSYYFTTCNMGVKKADRKFFQEILSQLGQSGEQIVMIDDTQKILDVARGCGVETILFTTKEHLMVQLQNLGISI